MAFAFFVVLNAILLIRPEELSPGLAGANLYYICICVCIFLSFPRIIEQFTIPSLERRPITVCVLFLLISMALSKLTKGQLDVLDTQVPDFAKVVLYFLLFLANINTPERMFRFMGWLVFIVVFLTTLSVLDFHQIIDIEAIQPLARNDSIDPETGLRDGLLQLVYTGIYSDPNDFCLIQVTAILCSLCRSMNASSVILRLFWLGPIVLCFYAILLTQSRGGLLGFIAGLLAFVYARYGAKKCLPLSILLVPAIIVFAGGRMAQVNVSQVGTAQERFALWSEGLSLMLANPWNMTFGIGVGMYAEECGLVAHNSFIHAYVELGIIGGTFFLGAFYLAAIGLWKSREDLPTLENSLPSRIFPFVFAIVIGYAAGCYSISRNFVVPTYLILGFAESFIAVTYYDRVPEWFRFNQAMKKRLLIVGIFGLIFLKLFTQLMLLRG